MNENSKNIQNQDKYWARFDEAWKKVIERFFPHLLRFFVPKLYDDVDWKKKISFLDREMEQLAIRSVKGAKYVDKLLAVPLKARPELMRRDGEEQWILVHIEVQGYSEEDFSERMFRYFYKIFDRYGRRVLSMAILTGKEEIPDEGRFELKTYGSGVDFRYLTFKLMDYDKEQLEKDPNPIALVVLVSQEKERAKRKGEKFNVKLHLIRKLYDRGYTKQEVIDLFEFIDWILQLSDDEERIVWEEIKELEEVKGMPYITSVERIGMERGLQQGLLEEGREMVLEALDEKFDEVSNDIADAVNQIEDRDRLKFLLRYAIRCSALEEFKQKLDGQN